MTQLIQHMAASMIMTVINYFLVTFGMWRLYPKIDVDRRWALVPFVRIYKLGCFADHFEDGQLCLTLQLVSFVLSIAVNILNYTQTSASRLLIILSAVSVAVTIMAVIYSIRIYSAICRLFHRKKFWIALWILVEPIPAIYWGLKPDIQVDEAERVKKAAGLSGIKAEEIEKGLTVNINARRVGTILKRKYLLKDIHLNLKPGRMVLLLGGSGAGKTTFVNAITGYEKADASILLDGVDVYRHFNQLKYDIGFVPQQELIRYNDTVYRTLADASALRMPLAASRKERKSRVNEVMEIFGLTAVKSHIVGKQSGGQKKRISIATEFISDPYLFILDEPDSGLDGILAKDLMRRLHEISREGKIVIVITHTPDRVIEMFDDVIVLAKDAQRTGRLVFCGSIPEAREFFGTDKMEDIVKMINRKNEGGEGLADELIEKFAEVRHD